MDTCDAFSCQTYESMSELSQLFTRLKASRFGEVKSLSNTTQMEWECPSRKSKQAEIFMICFLCMFLVFCLIGTSITALQRLFPNKTKKRNENALDKRKGYERNEWPLRCKDFFKCFCLLTNLEQLLNITPAVGDMPCLHGLRLLGQVCIIVFHTAGQLFYTAIRDFKGHIDVLNSWSFHISLVILFHSVDVFFFLSGMLNAHSFFQSAHKKKRKSWFHFYAHRFIRITPTYMIILGFYTIIFPYMGANTLWSTYPGEQLCKKYWWRNLLYISNIWPMSEMCMAWSWFLSNDMQFFVLSPLFLGTLWRWPVLGKSILVLCICGTVLANFILTYYFNLPNFFLHMYNNLGQVSTFDTYIAKLIEYYDQLYAMPYTRIGPYLIGVGVAYYLFKWNQTKKIQVNAVALCSGWIVAIIFMIYSIFGVSRNKELSVTESCLYNAMNQVCFTSVVAWIIFVCIRQGGVINDILSFKMLVPLSRLSYCAYLIHPMLMFGYVISLNAPFEFSYFTWALPVTCLTVGSFAVALIVHLVFECPIMRITKLLCNI